MNKIFSGLTILAILIIIITILVIFNNKEKYGLMNKINEKHPDYINSGIDQNGNINIYDDSDSGDSSLQFLNDGEDENPSLKYSKYRYIKNRRHRYNHNNQYLH